MNPIDKPKAPNLLAMAALSKAFNTAGKKHNVPSFMDAAEGLRLAALEAKVKELKTKGEDHE